MARKQLIREPRVGRTEEGKAEAPISSGFHGNGARHGQGKQISPEPFADGKV